jgi:hypothetical protein
MGAGGTQGPTCPLTMRQFPAVCVHDLSPIRIPGSHRDRTDRDRSHTVGHRQVQFLNSAPATLTT